MIISLINRSDIATDEEVQSVARAINRQIEGDFAPYWSFGARLRLEGAIGTAPDAAALADMRGDAVLYLWDQPDVADALGYHAANFAGIPYGFVFTKLSSQMSEHWSTTLSHEALELLGDPQTNLLASGPHPADRRRHVFHWFEMCDAVQAETYLIDGVAVSNFVLPAYFTPGEQEGARNDFLGRAYAGVTLRSFGVNPGGYVGFFDPATGKHDTWSRKDKKAVKRLQLKGKFESGRGVDRRHKFDRAGKPAAER